MQILLHTDPNTDGSHTMAEHLETTINAALGRFGNRVTRVEAHLSDENSQAKAGDTDIHCTLDARLVGQDAVIVAEQAANAHQAIEGAVRKLKRAVGAALEKHDPRNHRDKRVEPPAEAAPDSAG
jgi:ribosome-associated translation inhibitor RaiA